MLDPSLVELVYMVGLGQSLMGECGGVGGLLWWEIGLYRRSSVMGWWWVYWDAFAEEFSVTNGHSSRAIDTYNILVKLADFGDSSGFIPFGWVGANLILNFYVVTYDEWRRSFGMFSPSFSGSHVSVA
jgi:hypothetical protein